MLVVLAAVIAVAIVLVNALRSTAAAADNKLGNASSDAMKAVGKIK